MIEFIRLRAGFLAAVLKSRAGLQAENLALRHQLCVYQRSVKRPRVKPADRVLWSLLARAWTGWGDALIFVKPDTVMRWQRRWFKEHWRKLSASGEPGRPPVADEVKELIRTMSLMNPTWGSPRIVGESAKLGVTVNNRSRTHLSLDMDIPESRPAQMPDKGDVVAVPHVGGIHHRYERRAA